MKKHEAEFWPFLWGNDLVGNKIRDYFPRFEKIDDQIHSISIHKKKKGTRTKKQFQMYVNKKYDGRFLPTS